jgi:hypothetical protein
MDAMKSLSTRTENTNALSPHSYFRFLPLEAQQATIRRLALRGLDAEEIAKQIDWPVERVRFVI